MPVSPRAGSSTGNLSEPFSSPYRTETSYKNFSVFLNRKITVNSRFPTHFSRFSLLDILKHLDIRQAYLKGSTVHNWKSESAPADIDLQLFSNADELADTLPEKLLSFLDACSNKPAQGQRGVQAKTWFSKVSRDFQATWNRIIVSVGYPGANTTTLDLNFTNKPGIAYDTIHASKALYFDSENRKTALVDSWHPGLVDWVQQAGVLWFNPEIDEGLNRLSYRLCKSGATQLLQPDIAKHFFQQANATGIGSIYLRVLLGEYKDSRLNSAEQASLWQEVLGAAHAESLSRPCNLLADMLAWTKFNAVDQLEQALKDPALRDIAVERLKQGCMVGADFKSALRNMLCSKQGFKARLEPLINNALGAMLLPPDKLFAQLDKWDQIHNMPEHELQQVFSECLEHWLEHGDESIRQRCANMLGWLQADDLSSLKFWIDRIPVKSLGSPADKLLEPVLHAALQLIKCGGLQAIEPAMHQLQDLRLRKDQWTSLVNALLECEPEVPVAVSETPPPLPTDLMRLIVRHARFFSTDERQTPDVTAFHKDCMEFATRVQQEKLPQLLKSILSHKAGIIRIELADFSMGISLADSTVKIDQGRRQTTITPHCLVSSKAQNAASEARELRIVWQDGTLFAGQTVPGKGNACTGRLTSLNHYEIPVDIKGLVQAGRSLCTSKWPNTEFGQNYLAGQGQFNMQNLFKASGFGSGMQTMKEGELQDYSLDKSIQICHNFLESLPDTCSVTIKNSIGNPSLLLLFKPAKLAEPAASMFNNAWGVLPDTERIQTRHLQLTAPLGGILLTSLIPWHPEQQSLDGWGEVIGSGDVNFRWQGRFSSGELSPCGSLYLGESRQPVISFDAEESTANLPLSLLPVMADLLGKRLNGSYNFAPRVWGEKGTWPPTGFEGFINRFESANYTFTGYVTATGRAVGILATLGTTAGLYYSAFSGNFLVHPPGLLHRAPLSLDRQPPGCLNLGVRPGALLAPHGMVREHFVGVADQTVYARIDRVYFCGQGVSVSQITRNRDLVYDPPNRRSYLVGAGYTDKQKPVMLDYLFNAGDGGEDFVKIKPAHFDREPNFREGYADAAGTTASWVLVDQEYRMGQIRFPCGLEYSGQVVCDKGFYSPQGKGVINIGELSFAAEFLPNLTMKSLKAKNETSGQWLQTYSRSSGETTFLLPDFIELVTGGEASFQKDIQPHLLIRKLGGVKDEAVVFSRE